MNYRKISKDELAKILADHAEWLADRTKGASANLSFADLRSANLSSANLRSANLRSADLRSAHLRSAALRSADLSSADLSSANLSFADLSFADLRGADLLIFQFQRHTAYFTLDGTLRIGCHVLPISEWLISYENLGAEDNYSPAQIKAYGAFIRLCAEQFELHANQKPSEGE